MEKYKLLILLNIIIRISLVFIIPVSMFGEGLERFTPYASEILRAHFLFPEPPLLIFIWAGLMTFLSGNLLEISMKLVPVLFFIGALFLLPQIFKILKTTENEKLIITTLLIFSTPSLLYGGSLMMETAMLFFTFLLFLLIEKNKNLNLKHYISIAFVSALMLYTKQTGYFVFAGFFIYVLIKKTDRKNKTLTTLSLVLGLLLFLPWFIKNLLISPSVFVSVPFKEFAITSLREFLTSSKLESISGAYHYFWFIPLLSKVKSITSIKLLAVPYWTYYLLFFISTLALSAAILAGTVKFRKQYKPYFYLMLPLALLSLAWGYFLGFYFDAGRYFFSFHIFLYFFAARFIESLESKKLKKLFYLLIILFVLLSLVTAYATALRINSKHNQVKEIAEIVKDNNHRIFANDNFVRVTLKHYSGKAVEIVGSIDGELVSEENKIFVSDDYTLYFNKNVYYVQAK